MIAISASRSILESQAAGPNHVEIITALTMQGIGSMELGKPPQMYDSNQHHCQCWDWDWDWYPRLVSVRIPRRRMVQLENWKFSESATKSLATGHSQWPEAQSVGFKLAKRPVQESHSMSGASSFTDAHHDRHQASHAGDTRRSDDGLFMMKIINHFRLLNWQTSRSEPSLEIRPETSAHSSRDHGPKGRQGGQGWALSPPCQTEQSHPLSLLEFHPTCRFQAISDLELLASPGQAGPAATGWKGQGDTLTQVHNTECGSAYEELLDVEKHDMQRGPLLIRRVSSMPEDRYNR
ncbi:hypothetical protein V8F06_011944 [Rhypophila decipiens]